ncbi:hypothetical protein FB45DRAFT_1003492 [Roridomyces roridus]|uniref:Uncharacterized protein n=1 Tax=Roridomyces roridus TaxID=1738132 RepID=A0AAD7BT87_9AGAR|nr:hypothetical protein FB45DRAFT_1003492 [Roridomyces roridus]
MSLKFLSTILACLSLLGATTAQPPLAPKKYLSIPLGRIRPTGWLEDQIQVQTNGLAGHEHEFYDYVSQTDWTGGDSFYSTAEEAGSYWFNGMVPNGVLANNSEIMAKTASFLEYVLDHQEATGWFGPEVGNDKPRFFWGRYPFMFGAIQMVEFNSSLTDQVVTSLYKFVDLANSMLQDNNAGVDEWGAARWEDFVITLQWLYENHPNGSESQALLLDTMQRLRAGGIPWEAVFAEENFPKTAVEGLPNPFNNALTWHGVNVAEALKALPAAYRFSHNQSDLDSASAGWDLLFQYHGRPSGIFGADEYLAGNGAARGTELCITVEAMFSGSYLYQVIGDPKYPDQVERMAYNALPATLTGDMWGRQYLMEQNQIFAGNMGTDPFPTDGPYSNVFGLEPNYPCCTVNHPQGWPKFVTNAFVTTPDMQSLVHLYLGPFSTSVTLAQGNAVTANVDTLYPFSDTLTTTITAKAAFTYYVRIPSWVVGGMISVNQKAAQTVAPVNGLQAVAVGAGKTTIVLNLPAPITTESRPAGAIAVHRGPLHYAFDIPRTQKILATNAQQPLAVDLEFDVAPAADWQYAIDPSTLGFSSSEPESLPSPIFDSGLTPLKITVTACLINWAIAAPTFAASPPTNPACVGSPKNITLTPFGATKLRISEFPVFDSTA